jgi:hypothetical protein
VKIKMEIKSKEAVVAEFERGLLSRYLLKGIVENQEKYKTGQAVRCEPQISWIQSYIQLYMFCTVHSHISSNKTNMYMYYVFHFTHLHVSVPLDHLQGAFCYGIHCCLNVHVQYTSIYSAMEILPEH